MSTRARIGLDITPSRITAVRIIDAAKPTIANATVVVRDHHDEPFNDLDARRIASAMVRSGCDGGEIVVSAPVAHTLCAALELPKGVGLDDATRIAKIELARGSRLSPDSIECGWWEVPAPVRASDTRHVLAIGLAHSQSEAMIQTLERAGIQVAGIDTRPCAIARGLRAVASGGALVADIGDEHTLLFMTFEGAVLYSRVLSDVSLQSLYRKMRERCGLDERACDLILGDHAHTVMNAPGVRACVTGMYEALCAEVSRSFAYATHRYPAVDLKSLVLTGRGAGLPGLRNRLSDLGVRCVAPCVAEMGSLTAATFDLATRTDLTCAIGLASARFERMRGAA